MSEEFKVGQVWEYTTREHEVGSELLILKIDEVDENVIVHISLRGVQIINPVAQSGYADFVPHLPIALSSLEESVVKLIGNVDELPDFLEGYNLWQEAFASGEGGYFNLSVAQCIECMEETLNQ